MDGGLRDNDISKIVDLDRAHIWHHLVQHKPFETGEPRVIVEGKGMRIWDQKGKSIWMPFQAAYGRLMSATVARVLQMRCVISSSN